MRTAVLLSLIALSSALHAQVFTSGLENWTDTVPDGWVGVKTNISPDSIEQVSTNPHSGSYAVRLSNASNTTKRFTTQPLATDSAQSYDINCWVRGQGEVRFAMFDGRSQNSGYSPTGPYTTISSNTWTQISGTVVGGRTTPDAEFIIYVRNTISPDGVIVDDVNITMGAVVTPTPATVYAIQYTTDPNGVSDFDGLPVITGGIVTGVDTIGADSYFIQSGTGPWSGVYVYDQSNQPSIGDSVLLTANVVEFQGVTELSSVSAFSVVGQYPVPAPQLLDTYTATLEQWEGVLALLVNATCTTPPSGFGEWGINQTTGDYLADDLMFPYTPVVGNAYDITGCIHYANSAWKIEPRFAADIVAATGIAEEAVFASVTVGPVPANDVLYISLGELSGSRVECTLTDLLGRSIANGTITSDRNTINVSALTTGSYVLTLRTKDATRSTVVMVQH